MNRKKIILLLTGLVIASGMMTGCSSSNNKTDNDPKVAQSESGFRQSSEKTVTEYTGDQTDGSYEQYPATNYQENQTLSEQYPNVSYADEITNDSKNYENNTFNNTNEGINSEENLDGTKNYMYDSKKETQSLDSNSYSSNFYEEKQDFNDDNINSFQNNTDNSNQVTGFSGSVIDEEIPNLNSDVSSNVENKTTKTENTDLTNELNSNNNTSQPQGLKPQENLDLQKVSPETKTLTQADKIIGTFTPVKVTGESEIFEDGDSGQVQGTIELSFKLTGDVLDTICANVGNKSLRELISKAYTESTADANSGWPDKKNITLTDREKLQKGLKDVFTGNSELTLMFKDQKGTLVNIPFEVDSLFPDSAKNKQYVRKIIDLDNMRSINGRNSRNIRTIDSQDIPVKLLVRNSTVNGTGNDELKTNTTYTFVGIGGSTSDGNNLKVNTDKGKITGFYIPECTTAKSPATITAKKDDSTSAIYLADSNSEQGTKKEKYFVTSLEEGIYIDMGVYTTGKDVISSNGTSVKYNGIVISDPDDSIVKVEIEDSRGSKYPCTLVQVDSSDATKGSYIQVNGLERETSYTFTKIDIVSNVDGKEKTNTIDLGMYSVSGSPQLQVNNSVIKTTQFSEPKIQLGSTGPMVEVSLPDGIKVKPIKNDDTALRYIFKVDNSEGNIGEMRVIGLGSGETSNVQKIVDKKAKVNYYVVTLTNLKKDTDYGFLTLELDYKDPEGVDKVTRQSIGNVYNVNVSQPTLDNRTEKTALTGVKDVNVVINNEYLSKYPRKADVPIFVDDMHGRLESMTFTPVESAPEVNVIYNKKDNCLNVTGLSPKSSVDLTLQFNYKDENGETKNLTKYLKVITPDVFDVDIKTDTASVNGTEVKIKLDYYTTPKSPIKSVVIKDENDKEITSRWDPTTDTITLQGLEPTKDYSNLTATFTLQNTSTFDYKLTSFSTKADEVKPTGKVADFVQRVYTIALGREPEVEGWNYWIEKLENKEISATEFIAENLMTQPEFVDRELVKSKFITTMYSLIVNREPDEDGQRYWEEKYDEYKSRVSTIAELRIMIAREMMDQQEFKDLVTSINLKY